MLRECGLCSPGSAGFGVEMVEAYSKNDQIQSEKMSRGNSAKHARENSCDSMKPRTFKQNWWAMMFCSVEDCYLV